jgi:hypothetical protein
MFIYYWIIYSCFVLINRFNASQSGNISSTASNTAASSDSESDDSYDYAKSLEFSPKSQNIVNNKEQQSKTNTNNNNNNNNQNTKTTIQNDISENNMIIYKKYANDSFLLNANYDYDSLTLSSESSYSLVSLISESNYIKRKSTLEQKNEPIKIEKSDEFKKRGYFNLNQDPTKIIPKHSMNIYKDYLNVGANGANDPTKYSIYTYENFIKKKLINEDNY